MISGNGAIRLYLWYWIGTGFGSQDWANQLFAKARMAASPRRNVVHSSSTIAPSDL